MKQHNKLVRDNIPQIVLANGGTAQTRHIDDDFEFITELTKSSSKKHAKFKKTQV
jgi:predicted house-cleaning noncanonical NTP pyrophosphatase (MazG superfamily)